MILSFVMAAVATFGMALVMSGALQSLHSTREGTQLVGIIFSGLTLVPSLIGIACGFSAKARQNNPVSVTIAIIWNLALVSIFVLLCIIGSFRS